jgi:hypothetical protein
MSGLFHGGYMSVEIKVTPKNNMVIVQITGRITLQDLAPLTEKITDGKKYLYSRRLYDFRKCEIDLSTEEMNLYAKKTMQLDQEYSKIALLVSGELTYGLSRMYQVFRDQDNTDIKVFRDEDKAMDWIISD